MGNHWAAVFLESGWLCGHGLGTVQIAPIKNVQARFEWVSPLTGSPVNSLLTIICYDEKQDKV